MKEKKILYSEIAFVLGIIILAFGTAFMERADFGMSMIVAPAYLVHLKVSQYVPFFSFGVAEYAFQGVLLVLLSIVMKKVKKSYLLSFATVFIYGLVLDVTISIIGLITYEGMVLRILFFVIGMVFCSTGVALVFHSYLPPEAYEIVVKEISKKFNLSIGKVKTVYDCCSCVIAIVLSFVFYGFGSFVGIGWGTVVCAIVNGWLIGRISSFFEKRFDIKDGLTLKNILD